MATACTMTNLCCTIVPRPGTAPRAGNPRPSRGAGAWRRARRHRDARLRGGRLLAAQGPRRRPVRELRHLHRRRRPLGHQGDGIIDYSPPLFYARVCLQLSDAAASEEVTATFTLSLQRRDRGGVSPVASRTMTAAFGAAPRDRPGFHKLVDASSLRRPWWRRCFPSDDTLIIRCVHTVVQD